jgi:nitrogen fixation protein FixH
MRGKLGGGGVLLWLVAFFGVVIAVNVIFIVEAVQTFRGEDQQDPYLQGVDYNHTIARRELQAKLGWRATIDGERQRDGVAILTIILRRHDGTPVDGLRLAGTLRHPVDQNRDRVLVFAEQAPGRYESRIAHVSAGAWDAVVHAGNGVAFEADRRIWMR